ncbi:MAG: mycoredoxin [Anaerolineales bacterium]
MSEQDLYNTKPSKIVMYTTSWCPDCKRSKAFLNSHNIEYLEVDVGKDQEAYRFVEKLTRRVRIPTLFFPDGSMMIEPSDEALFEKIR